VAAPYVPHTDADRAAMLARLGLPSMEALFAAEVPAELLLPEPPDLGPGLDEQALLRRLGGLAEANVAARLVCFCGGGYYDRYIPAAERALLARGEFTTAYTPYQPEVSQGTLQVTFEFQTMISELCGLPVATAGLYDGSTALAEAVLLALAATGRRTVLLAEGVHPEWREVVRTYGEGRGLRLGRLGEAADPGDVAAVVVQQPDFFGRVVDVAACLKARPAGALGIVAANPATLGVLEAPGRLGADVVVGEGQSVGLPLSYGGPYVGFMAARTELLRRLPGRICGLTHDLRGRRAFVLTLQAREQHIRRARATSNICTNQALCALAVTIYLSLLGPRGLRRLGELCLARAHYLAGRLAQVPGVRLAFPDEPFFDEFAVRVPDAAAAIRGLAERGYLVGPQVDAQTLLIAVTEKRDRAEMDGLVAAFAEVVGGG
jgi:glycine dehydrogenase subunit 1